VGSKHGNTVQNTDHGAVQTKSAKAYY